MRVFLYVLCRMPGNLSSGTSPREGCARSYSEHEALFSDDIEWYTYRDTEAVLAGLSVQASCSEDAESHAERLEGPKTSILVELVCVIKVTGIEFT